MLIYLRRMPVETLILWVYIIWYLTIAALYFDASPSIWLNALGLSIIVGTALMLATGPINRHRFQHQFWQLFRLYCCPFCVSSFSALSRNNDFVLILPPDLSSNLLALTNCLVFTGSTLLIKYRTVAR